MYVMIRRYTMEGSIDGLMQTVDERFASQFGSSNSQQESGIRVDQLGIVGYQAVDTGNKTLLTITVFESEQDCHQAQATASAIRESLAQFDVHEIETLMGPIRVSRAAAKLLDPVHP